MPTLTLKNIPTALHRRLKRRAELSRRSLNSEVIACLEKAVGSQPIQVDTLLEKARQIRKAISGNLTDQDLHNFKEQGRP